MFEGLEGIVLISDIEKVQDYQKSLVSAGLNNFRVIQIVIKDGKDGEEIDLRTAEKAECLVFDDSIIDRSASRSEVADFLKEVQREFHGKIIFFTHWDDTDSEGNCAELILLGRGEDSIKYKCQGLAKRIKKIFH